MPNTIDQKLSFLKIIEKEKTVLRKTYCSKTSRKESDAEHTWHVAMFVMLFQDELPNNVNVTKLLKMALIHDLIEVYAGDTFPFDTEAMKGKKEREMKAAKKLFSKLPQKLEKEFTALFKEFEEGKTKEAKLVQAFDKLQPLLQNICARGKAWKENGLTRKIIERYKLEFVKYNGLTSEIFTKLLDEGVRKKYLRKGGFKNLTQ